MARKVVRCVKEILAKRKQHWAEEQPKLDNARRLTGLYHADPEDFEFRKMRKNARNKLEVHVDFAMPCKLRNHKDHIAEKGPIPFVINKTFSYAPGNEDSGCESRS